MGAKGKGNGSSKGAKHKHRGKGSGKGGKRSQTTDIDITLSDHFGSKRSGFTVKSFGPTVGDMISHINREHAQRFDIVNVNVTKYGNDQVTVNVSYRK